MVAASRLGGALKRGQRRMLGPAVIAGIRAASDECALQTFEDLGRTARDDWKVAPGAVDPKRRPEQYLGIGMPGRGKQIGRASCRARGCQFVEISVVDVELKKRKLTTKEI